MNKVPKIAMYSCGSWYLPHSAAYFEKQDALAGLYVSDPNRWGISSEYYHQCRVFDLTLRSLRYPFRRNHKIANGMFWRLFPLWAAWLKRQPFPDANIVHALGIFATEPFNYAEKNGCLKVFDAANSHPLHQKIILENEYRKWGGALPREFYWYMPRAIKDLARSDLVLCPSEFVLETMVRHGVDRGKCVFAPFGVDTSLFTPREALPEHPVFICVGFIGLRKGHQYLFEAFAEVKKKHPDAELVCVGGYHSDFRMLKKKWEGSFTHYPHVNHQKLSQILRTSTAFVLPSVEEGYARVIPEAMASGLPVILTRESGAGKQIQDGVNGYWVDVGDVKGLAHRMCLLCEDRDLNRTMGVKASESTGGTWNWEDYGACLLNKYNQVLNL